MGFIAKRFSFDRIPCSEYGLRIYDIDGNSNDATPFASAGELQTDVIPSKGRTFLYGRTFDDPLEFNLVFGLDPLMLNMDEHLDRYEMDAIANWLTGHDSYKWLEIEQPDLEIIRYRCIISELKPIQIAWLPFAFSAKVMCDSPYSYTFPQNYHYSCTGKSLITLRSKSTINKLYYPKLSIQLNGSNTISIVNQSCDNTEMKFTDLPKDYFMTITVDNDLGKISCSDATYSNMYQYFNFQWLPLKRGMNKLLVTGNCLLDFDCEFPINVGG
jgi:phage-related protein